MINYDLNKIKAFFLDVDGVLSRQTITLHENGDPLRSVNIKDGYALQYAVKKGYHIAIITGAKTEAIKLRYNRLGIHDVVIGADVKIIFYEQLKLKFNLNDEQILYMGDDIPDYEIMTRCGLPCCPADAAPEIKQISAYIASANGGEGCVREVVEQVMKAQNLWMNDNTAFGW